MSGILGDKVIGFIFSNGTLTRQIYTIFYLRSCYYCWKMYYYKKRLTTCYQHDGCPAHVYVTRDILNDNCNSRWIRCRGPIHWSPDLTSPDFFLWGYLKEMAYINVSMTPENMQERIRNSCANIERELLLCTHHSFHQRIGKCIEVAGHHFEHLLQ